MINVPSAPASSIPTRETVGNTDPAQTGGPPEPRTPPIVAGDLGDLGDLGSGADKTAFVQRPSDLLHEPIEDMPGVVASLRQQGQALDLPPRYFALVDSLPGAELATARLALDTLTTLPEVLARLPARQFTPTAEQVARVVASIGIRPAHQPLVQILHDAARAFLQEDTADSLKVLKRYLCKPGYTDPILDALLTAAGQQGISLSPQALFSLETAACDTHERNLAFRKALTTQLQDWLDGTGPQPDFAQFLERAGQIERLEAGEVEQSNGQRAEDEDRAARVRPDYHGLPLRNYNDPETGELLGPSQAQVDGLPSMQEVQALGRALYPHLADPLRHMAPLSLVPQIRVHYRQASETDPTRLHTTIELSFDDPQRTSLENRLRLAAAQALLRTQQDERCSVDPQALTISYQPSVFGSSNDLAIKLPGTDEEKAFVDDCIFLVRARHNKDDYFLPSFFEEKFIAHSEDAGPGKVSSLCHLAATRFRSETEAACAEFGLRFQLPPTASEEDTAQLLSTLGGLLDETRVAPNGPGRFAQAALLRRPQCSGGPGSFVDAQGRPAFRCRPDVGRETLEATLAEMDLQEHFELQWDEPAAAWTAVTIGVPATPDVRSIQSPRGDHVPLRLWPALANALACSDSAQGDLAATSPVLSELLERFRSALAEIMRTVDQHADDFGALQAAVQPLVDLQRDIQRWLPGFTPDSPEHRLLSTLDTHTQLVQPVQERARLLAPKAEPAAPAVEMAD